MSFFHTTEFYIILFLAAVAIVGFLAMPHGSEAAREYLLGSELMDSGGEDEPSIAVDCDESGNVWLRRFGLADVHASGAVSAKVVVKGFNITVYERVVEGRYDDEPADTALFQFDFLASERYYLRYESESASRTATLAFRNVPGYHADARLKQ